MKRVVRADVARLDDLDGDTQSHLASCFAAHFGHVPYVWEEPRRIVLARDRDVVAGHAGMFEREVSVGALPVRVGGIGGVVTHEAYRRSGVARAMLEQAVTTFRSDRLQFALLLCREEVVPVYESSGWRRVDVTTRFQQPDGPAIYPRVTMVIDLAGRAWPAGDVDMAGLPW
jgi:GNAT superfamily N-acetyltransferase